MNQHNFVSPKQIKVLLILYFFATSSQ